MKQGKEEGTEAQVWTGPFEQKSLVTGLCHCGIVIRTFTVQSRLRLGEAPQTKPTCHDVWVEAPLNEGCLW